MKLSEMANGAPVARGAAGLHALAIAIASASIDAFADCTLHRRIAFRQTAAAAFHLYHASFVIADL